MTINKQKALELLGDDDEMYREVCQLFLQHTPHQVDEMQKSFDSRDFETLSRIAHSMKSASGSIGAENLKALAERLEHLSKKADLENIQLTFENLLSELKLVLENIKHILNPMTKF